MYKKLIVLLTLVFATSMVSADAAKHRALAEEMLEVSKASSVLDNMSQQVNVMFAQTVQQMNLPQERQAEAEKYQQRLNAIMKEELSWEKLKGQFADVYVDVFNEQELKELVEFYKSPLGQKLIIKMPQLMQESMGLAQKQMQAIIPKIKALSQEMQAELYQQPNG
ncbi:DUF2059 domain-containing protein [Alkalimarinus sediminis]|uniref:DUF2059 domain-containing protein n=1 Tax=Alkalimarinus sediminis TaxID=1632866 RepID=A0A9E8HJN0_9ALTE|nr:DUF2059 domain-containing protein [Alkalimarinus sediminis]UZW73951.1 DUF2059 domain-containing protein [Alkalimarinus sediminis]